MEIVPCRYAIGGHDGLSHLSTAEVFDPQTGFWRRCAPMKTSRRGIAVAALDAAIYAVGGLDDSTCFSVSTDANRLGHPILHRRVEDISLPHVIKQTMSKSVVDRLPMSSADAFLVIAVSLTIRIFMDNFCYSVKITYDIKCFTRFLFLL